MLVKNELNDCLKAVEDGKIILYPTETVWGIGCDPFNEEAVTRLAQLKGRSLESKPFILLFPNIEMVEDYVMEIHPRVKTLLGMHKRPLTIIYQANSKIPSYLKHNDGTVAIRVPSDQHCLEFMQVISQPLISTSANFSTEKATADFNEINEKLVDEVDFVYKPLRINMTGKASVLATFDKKGNLIFIRE